MDQKDLQEWSRHFDILLWTMTALVAAGAAGLLVYSNENPDPYLCLGGIFVTNVGVYLTASFRGLRRKVHIHLDDEIIKVIRPSKLRQWPILLLAVAVLLAAWVGLLCKIEPNRALIWVLIGVLAFVLDVYWIIWADKPPRIK